MSEDLIRRSDVIEALKDNMVEMGGEDFSEIGVHSDDVDAIINDIPTIEPKRGEWIYGEHDVAMCDGYRCDRCGFFVPWDYEHKSIDFINDYNFCPNCGARMKGAEDEASD